MSERKRVLTPAALSAALDGDFGNFLAATTPGGIEAQEAAGQAALVASDTLPTDLGWGDHIRDRAILEAAGVQFLGVCENDPLFQRVILPAGWKKVPTDHSMWSKLVDETGRERAAIFYKAAFYDRKAHMTVSQEETSK